MLERIVSPITTASALGVAIRYLTAIAGSIVAILGILGWLTAEQVEGLTKQVPELLTAIGALVAALVPLYAVFTKSSSDKAARAAKAIDRKIPKREPVVIKTPAGTPDIVVLGK